MDRCDKAQELVELLREEKLHVTTAESCTGGMIAAKIVDVAGASEVFEEGYITYSDRVKTKVLGVSADTIETETVVSSSVAEEMAVGAAAKAGAQLAISITGYAGPEPAEDGTPAGTVYIGVSFLGQVKSYHLRLDGGRNQVRREAAEEAIGLALETVKWSKES